MRPANYLLSAICKLSHLIEQFFPKTPPNLLGFPSSFYRPITSRDSPTSLSIVGYKRLYLLF